MTAPIPRLQLGTCQRVDGLGPSVPLSIDPADLVTHAVVVGATGSGKTGLLTVLMEEALRAGIPVLAFDVKGDLSNLCLRPDVGDVSGASAWLDPEDAAEPGHVPRWIQSRTQGLAAAGITAEVLAQYRDRTHVRILTPGTNASEPVHVLSALERRSPLWDTDPEGARSALSGAVSLVLRLLGRDADPARSREHVLLSVLAEQRLRAGRPADLGALLQDLAVPPFDQLGALPLDTFFPPSERTALAVALDTLLVSPSFTAWREGAPVDVAAWLAPGPDGRTPAVLVNVSHLDDGERTLVLGVVLDELLSWVRGLRGTHRLRALVVLDEAYGFLPPHPANPPTKRPMVALLKQARAYGVGIVVATQNPMDLDYRALGNAGIWCVGRLQTDADRARVVDGLTGGGGADRKTARALAARIAGLPARTFVMRDAAAGGALLRMSPRYAMSLLRGPMTREELRRVG